MPNLLLHIEPSSNPLSRLFHHKSLTQTILIPLRYLLSNKILQPFNLVYKPLEIIQTLVFPKRDLKHNPSLFPIHVDKINSYLDIIGKLRKQNKLTTDGIVLMSAVFSRSQVHITHLFLLFFSSFFSIGKDFYSKKGSPIFFSF